jgi:hypothetical protein
VAPQAGTGSCEGAVRGRRRVPLLLALSAAVVAGCTSGAVARAPEAEHRPPSSASSAWGVSVPGAPACNPLGGQACMLPFPSDYYTTPDASMPSGRRVDLPIGAMPRNAGGVPIAPGAWERNDGFSPGSPILVLVPDLSARRTGLPTPGDVRACTDPGSPVVLLDAATGRRLECWAELDAEQPVRAARVLVVHPAADLPLGARIIVALRNLVDTSGRRVPPQAFFRAALAGRAPNGRAERALALHERSLLPVLARAGVSSAGLYLAWDFTVESEQNLAGWALHMRDVAFRILGRGVPRFAVTTVDDFTPAENADIARQVSGTFEVPSFLDEPGGPEGSVLHFGPDGLPSPLPGNLQRAVFSCLLPRSTGADGGATPVQPGWPVLYGKGLFSLATEMDAPGVIATAERYRLVLCSTNWMGLDLHDVLDDAAAVGNLSEFPTIPDRLLQSMVDALFLGRLMASRAGFDASAAFRSHDTPLIDTGDPLVYYGNSEGSLIGGALTAISTEWRRAVLGVPGMDYALLLPRSVDFLPFQSLLDRSYPHRTDQLLIYDLLSMLWDRAETDGYAENLVRDPLPATPVHQVLLQMAFGDHQVSNVATEAEARTLGVAVHRPALPASLVGVVGHPFSGLPSLSDRAVAVRAALYEWVDTRVATPPAADVPPTEGPDPHDSIPRSVPGAQEQLVVFLETGRILDVCGAGPCLTSQPIP